MKIVPKDELTKSDLTWLNPQALEAGSHFYFEGSLPLNKATPDFENLGYKELDYIAGSGCGVIVLKKRT